MPIRYKNSEWSNLIFSRDRGELCSDTQANAAHIGEGMRLANLYDSIE